MALQILINIIYSFSIYILISLSFSIIYYVIKFFHIAHAIIITSAAYFSYLFSQQFGLSLWISFILALISATGLGILIEIAIYKPLRKRKATALVMLISSLGFYIVIQNIISMIWGDDTKSIRLWEVKTGNEILGAYITNVQIITIIICIALFAVILVFLKYSKDGKNIRALSSNKELTNIFGIDSNRLILLLFGIGSALAAIVGILIACDTDMTPTMGFNLILYGVVAMIIGGVGSTWGLVGGSLLLATTQHLAAYYIDSKWMDAVAYIILILFLIWKPLGFSGKRLKKMEI